MEELVDQKEAARLFGVSVRTMEAWRLSGRSPVYLKVGRQVRYRRSDLEAWLDGRKRRSTSDPGDSPNEG